MLRKNMFYKDIKFICSFSKFTYIKVGRKLSGFEN